MKFYLCDTTPPTIARTQADAKATGASFGPIEIDTSQQGLTDAFNKFISEAAATSPQAPSSGTEPGQEEDAEGNSTISPPKRPKPAPELPTGKCGSCGRLEIEEEVWNTMSEPWLQMLEANIAERRAELAKAAEPKATVNPPARRRKA